MRLTATPDANSTFANWSGGGCTGTGACSITIGTSDVGVTAKFGVRPQFQPDLWIKAGSGKYLGNDVYTSNGTGETAAATGGRGAKKVFTIYLETDGAASSDTIQVAGTGSSAGFKIRYSTHASNLSAPNGSLAVRPITMDGQHFAVLTLTVTVLSSAPHGAVKAVSVTATSKHAASAKDAVKAKVSVL